MDGKEPLTSVGKSPNPASVNSCFSLRKDRGISAHGPPVSPQSPLLDDGYDMFLFSGALMISFLEKQFAPRFWRSRERWSGSRGEHEAEDST